MPVKIFVSFAYLSILILFAFRARKRTKSVEDYYVGARNISTGLVVLSFYATFVSTNSFVGHSAKSYIYGISWLLVGAVLVLLTLFAWAVIAPRFRERAAELGSVVPSDLFRLHFGSPAAGAVAASIILFDSVFFLGAVFLGAAEAMGALIGLPFAYALVTVFTVQLLYTAVGGYLADVWSDSLQAGILFVGAIVLPIALVVNVGGWDAMWTKLGEIDAAEPGTNLLRTATGAPLLVILGIGLSGGLKLVADPRQLSRFYGLRGCAAARRGVFLVTGIVAVTYLFLLPVGLFSRALGVPAEAAQRTDAIVPYLLGEARIVGPVLGGVILTALLAAAMSTIDSVLLVAAAAVQRDLLPILTRRSASESVAEAKRIVLACALLSLALAVIARANPSAGLGIVELSVFAGALYAGAFLPGLLGLLYWPGSSATGVIAGMIGGVVSTGVWKFVMTPIYPGLASFPEVFIGLLFGTAGVLVGSATRPQPRPH